MARKFKFEWRITLLVLFLLPLLIGLGFWQLHRADHNRALVAQAERQRKEAPIFLTELLQKTSSDREKNKTDAWHLKQVKLRGRWLSNVFLLENQIYAERNGYYVFGVMQLEGAGLVLVNRGWVAAPALRSELPTVPPVVLGDEVGEVYVSPAWAEHSPLFAESRWCRKRIALVADAGGGSSARGFSICIGDAMDYRQYSARKKYGLRYSVVCYGVCIIDLLRFLFIQN